MKLFILILFIINSIFGMTGLELAELIDSRIKPIDISSINTMVLTNKKNKSKTLELISISKDNSKKQMIWFIQPTKNKGTSFLKIEHDDKNDYMVMWLPGISRLKSIRSNEKSDSFMGSDLSFEDLTNRTISDYNYKITDYTDNIYTLESMPNNIDSEYGKHVTKVKEIEADIFIAIEEESFDQNNQLLKTKFFSFTKIDSFYVMNKLEVKNVQKNHSTLLTVNDISLNNNFDDLKFVERNLKFLPEYKKK